MHYALSLFLQVIDFSICCSVSTSEWPSEQFMALKILNFDPSKNKIAATFMAAMVADLRASLKSTQKDGEGRLAKCNLAVYCN